MTTEILTANQIYILGLIGKERTLAKQFYLTGGTPLAAFYLHHRYSEDLDFFSEQEVDPSALHAFFKKHQKTIGFKKLDFQQSYNRNLFFLHLPDEVLKMEFTYFPFPRIGGGELRYGVEVDSLEDIAVNKLFTIYQRTKARDYIDLYIICREKGYRIPDLFKKARIKFDWHIDPLQLGTQFLNAKQAEDMPHLLISLPDREWQDFFAQQAKALKKDIFES